MLYEMALHAGKQHLQYDTRAVMWKLHRCLIFNNARLRYSRSYEYWPSSGFYDEDDVIAIAPHQQVPGFGIMS